MEFCQSGNVGTLPQSEHTRNDFNAGGVVPCGTALFCLKPCLHVPT